MTIQRMDNVGIVVDDLDGFVAFFTELGMEQEGSAQIEGLWAGLFVGPPLGSRGRLSDSDSGSTCARASHGVSDDGGMVAARITLTAWSTAFWSHTSMPKSRAAQSRA